MAAAGSRLWLQLGGDGWGARASPPLQGSGVVMGSGRWAGVSLLAPPHSSGIGKMPLGADGWAIFFRTLGTGLCEDP